MSACIPSLLLPPPPQQPQPPLRPPPPPIPRLSPLHLPKKYAGYRNRPVPLVAENSRSKPVHLAICCSPGPVYGRVRAMALNNSTVNRGAALLAALGFMILISLPLCSGRITKQASSASHIFSAPKLLIMPRPSSHAVTTRYQQRKETD
jgi:hypothetical protein